jgi:hypothetical protein
MATAKTKADPYGMTSKKATARATATATANTGILHFVQDDDLKLVQNDDVKRVTAKATTNQIPFGNDKQEVQQQLQRQQQLPLQLQKRLSAAMATAVATVVLGADLFGYAFYGVVGGEYGAFLPGYEMREVVSGEVGSTLGFVELGVGGLSAWEKDISEAADGVGDLCPADVDGFGE